MYCPQSNPAIDVAHLIEQVNESYDEFASLIERNPDIARSIETIEGHLAKRNNYERAVFAISAIETQCHHEQRFMSRFPGKVGTQASSALATLLECAAMLRSVI